MRAQDGSFVLVFFQFPRRPKFFFSQQSNNFLTHLKNFSHSTKVFSLTLLNFFLTQLNFFSHKTNFFSHTQLNFSTFSSRHTPSERVWAQLFRLLMTQIEYVMARYCHVLPFDFETMYLWSCLS